MEENNDNKEKDLLSLNNIPSDKLLNQATLRDLILFKEDILKEMRQYASKIKTSLSEKFNKYVEETNEKLPISNENNAGLYMKNIKFIEEKNNILSTLSEKEANLNEKIMVNDLHINTCQKELNDAVFKYDRAILDNLLIPGLVGKGCKFVNFKDYMSDIQSQMKNAFNSIEFNSNNINKNNKNLEEKINDAFTKIKNLEYELKQFTFEKTLVLENKTKQEMETMNKNIIELTGEFYKNNVELKNQIESLKKTEKLITEENRRINYHTIKEFEIIQKGYKLMKKAIIDLGKLLMLSDKRTNKNKNFAANKQLIIEQFNNMIMGLVKEVRKETPEPQPKEAPNQKTNNPKKAVSVIKQYIEGKIPAEKNNYNEMDRKKNNINQDKDNKENEAGIHNRNSNKRASYATKSKMDDANLSKLNANNNKQGASFEKYKKFSRHASVEFKDISKQNSLGSNTNINNDSDSKKNTNNNNIIGEANRSRHFGIIKEEKNNISKSDDDSLFADLEEDFKNLKLAEQDNIFNYKKYENKKYEDENSLNADNSLNKPKKINKNKMFLRAVTTNYDIVSKKSENINKTPENFKLLLKAQENLKKKNLEKLSSFKKDSGLIPDKNNEKRTSTKKLNINYNQDKVTDKKQNPNTDNYSNQNNINSFIQDSSRLENKNSNTLNKIEEVINNKKSDKKIVNQNYTTNKSDKIIEKTEIKNEANNHQIYKENINNEDKKIKEINDLKTNNEIKKEENNTRTMEKLDNFPKEKSLLNYKLKDNLENETMTEKYNKNKNKINVFNNNFARTQYSYKIRSPINKSKNVSPENNKLQLAKIENNKENTKREINLSANVKTHHPNLINKFPTQSNIYKSAITNLKAINKPLKVISESLTKTDDKYKIRKSYNILNEDIFVNKDDIKKMNYIQDKDIIDRPLIANQLNFNVQNVRGGIENKIIELEYFTKKKFDELVREIKNFIPIHFNAYVKE